MMLGFLIGLCAIPVLAIFVVIARHNTKDTGYNPHARRSPRDDGAFDHGDEPL